MWLDRCVNSAFRERGLKPPWSLNAALTQLLRRLPRIKRGCLAVLLHDVCTVVAKAAEPLGAVRARKAQQVRIRVLALLVHEVHHLADVPILVVIAGLEIRVIGVLEFEHISFAVLMLLWVVQMAEVAGAVAFRSLWDDRDWSIKRCNEFLNLLERFNAVEKQDSMPMRLLWCTVLVHIGIVER